MATKPTTSPRKGPQLAFSYPRRGLTGKFNTFRLGVGSVKECLPGRVVELVCSRTGKLLGKAEVKELHIGRLHEMAFDHSEHAHNWKGHPFQDNEGRLRPRLLIESMKKRCPPGRVRDDSTVTVIYLQEIPNEVL